MSLTDPVADMLTRIRNACQAGHRRVDVPVSKLKTELANVKAWVEHTSRLGGKTIRIFAGSVAKGDDEDKARDRAVATRQTKQRS